MLFVSDVAGCRATIRKSRSPQNTSRSQKPNDVCSLLLSSPEFRDKGVDAVRERSTSGRLETLDHGGHRGPGSASTRRPPSACTTRTRPRSTCSRRQSTCSRSTYLSSARRHEPRTKIHSDCQHEPTRVHRENATSASRLERNLGPHVGDSLVLAAGHGRDNLGSAASSSLAKGHAAPTGGHCHLDSASGHGTATTTWIIGHGTTSRAWSTALSFSWIVSRLTARTQGHGRSRVEATTAYTCAAQVKITAETSCSTSGLILTSGFIFNCTLRDSSVAPIIPPRERGSEHSTAVFRMRTRDGSSAAMRRARMHALVRDLLFVAGG